MDEARRARLNRLRWHSRRALLELDLVLQRYWSRVGLDVDADTEAALGRLLAIEDHELWELVCDRQQAEDPQLTNLLEALRQL